MMQKADIRPAVSADAEVLCMIDDVSFPDDEKWSGPSFLSSIDSENETVIVAVDPQSGKVTGYAAFSYVFDEANLNKIAVLPEYRSFGTGKLLLDEMERILPDEVTVCNLEVREHSRAVDFYLRSGYEKVGKRKRFYRDPDEDAVLMTKRKVMI